MTKIIVRNISLMLAIAIGAMTFPAVSLAASYDYDYTQVGTGGINNGSAYDYSIDQEQLSFSSEEDVWVLSKIIDISDIDQFRLRHQVLVNNTNVYRTLYSPTYNPSNSTWSKTYSYNNFGPLVAGNYEIRVSMSVNGGAYTEVDTVDISVAVSSQNYTYTESLTGLGVQAAGTYTYDIVDGKTDFTSNDSIHILTKLANINNIETFRIRHQVLADGTSEFKTLYSPEFNPNLDRWGVNHTWNEFGFLPVGDHAITIAISVNGGAYEELERIDISVTGATEQYLYEESLLGLGIQPAGSYTYEIIDGKNSFDTSESIYVLTKLKNINNVNTFRIRHQVLANRTSLYRELFSPSFSPNLSRWSVNQTWNNFGQLPPGNHALTVAISVNGGEYTELDRINFEVVGTNEQYLFDTTDLGTGIISTGNYTYDITDPKTTFVSSENIYALTKLTGINNVNTFRIKNQVLAGGTTVFTELFTPTFSPSLNRWGETNTWTIFNSLPAGNHILKTFISIDGGEYIELDSQDIVVQ